MRVAYTLRPEDLTPDFLNGLAALFNSQTQTLNVVVETNDAPDPYFTERDIERLLDAKNALDQGKGVSFTPQQFEEFYAKYSS